MLIGRFYCLCCVCPLVRLKVCFVTLKVNCLSDCPMWLVPTYGPLFLAANRPAKQCNIPVASYRNDIMEPASNIGALYGLYDLGKQNEYLSK